MTGRDLVSNAVQDYLKVIYKLANAPHAAEKVTTSVLAERMKVSAASASNMIKKLAEIRLLRHAPYQGVELTEAGEKIALEIIRYHRLLELYLRDALGYDWDQVDEEADRLEHAISEDFEKRIDIALGHPTVGAHGEPIPTKNGDIAVHRYHRLSDLGTGQRACIRQVSDRNPEMLRYLDESGLVLGTKIEIREKVPFKGPLLLLALEAGREQHIGLEVAESVFVEMA
ncbi:MAG: metal-dependent transcriptional regulator [Candidatus Latescibacterota bacterium]|nr:metal-dependent transcriptional regulator [Candidatus Latescibacterota bacterium]